MFGVTKNLVIGVVWALVTALLPVTLAGATAWTSADLWLLMLPFDVEDVDRDAEEGVRTIPRRQGLTFTRWLIGVLLAALAALQLIHYQGYLLGGQLLVSAYIGILLWLLQPRRSDLHFLGFWDGAIALQALLMLVLSS
jgi:4-hydroxybenzoate polyprenyltransferase